MPNETESRTNAQRAMRTRYLSEPSKMEGMALMESALIEEGVPEDAASRAAEAYGAALEADEAEWGSHEDPNLLPKAMGETNAEKVLEALQGQAKERPRENGWIRIDWAMARKRAGLTGCPMADFDKAVSVLVSTNKIVLRVIGSNDPVPCFKLVDTEGAK
jgi:hypothetical protein